MRLFIHMTLPLLAATLLPTALARASGCDCGSIEAMLFNTQMQIVQKVNSNTNAEAQGIRTEITEAAQNIIGTIRVSSQSIVRALVDLKESTVAALKGHAAAREAQKTSDLYGKAGQPNGLCGSTAVGAGLQVGLQAGTRLHQDMRHKQVDYGNTPSAKPLEYLRRLLDEEHPDVKTMPDVLFPLERTLTADQLAQAHETIKTLADPRPLPLPTETQKETPAGEAYTAARLVHQGRIQNATELLNFHVAFHAPTLPDDVTAWAREQWQEAGAAGTPPGIVDGKLSEAALFNLLVQTRLGNPNWFTHIAEETEPGLLRELVLLQAIQLQMTHKNTELLDRLAVVDALDYLTRLEGRTGKDLDTLYGLMVGTQQ
ncbi:MAG: hypothetical protein IJU37_10435 [Desulfovibrio sp.]|nr:hypothetical protein [Desulfovibrio sp.]